MAPRERLSREQKGKAVATVSDPARDVMGNGSPLENFSLIHRDAMMNTVILSLPQRILVTDAARLFREEGDGQTASDDQYAMRSIDLGGSRRRPIIGRSVHLDYYPTCYYPGGIFEELPTLAPDLKRPSAVEGQDWGNVEATWSTMVSVKKLLRECRATGVTFLVPTHDQRPWSPPVRYHCVYELFFRRTPDFGSPSRG